ncbi:MAG TPA: hypothetical protein VER58_16630 [Thermoanaerobaculia bacterium]|nr:hypothetical protein [Thermoanaerobaculia bacterium]
MYSKYPCHATCALALLFALGCAPAGPWQNEPVGSEINMAFAVRNNLLFLDGATIDGRHGRFLIGSAQSRTVVDPKFAIEGLHSLQLSGRESLRFMPVVTDLGGIADGIVGKDIWGSHAITIDYRAGLLTFQREGMHPELMIVYRYSDDPTINVVIDGRVTPAIVDTTSPDSLVLPRTSPGPGRRNAHIQIADTDFGNVDVRVADVSAPRVGNRLLSRFLISIDYGRHQVGLWRDPRIAL